MCATTKYESDTWMSNGMTASMIPLMPPSVNIVMNPSANSMGVRRWITPRHSVASQEKILMPVGTAISIVVVKLAQTSSGMRQNVMPGARIVMIVTRKLSAVAIDEAPANWIATLKNVCPSGMWSDSGAYAVQP